MAELVIEDFQTQLSTALPRVMERVRNVVTHLFDPGLALQDFGLGLDGM
jgi:hypothetical protein